MKSVVKGHRKVRFGNSRALLEKLKAKRPDLIAAALAQPLRVVVGKNLVRLRREEGLSREALAERCAEVGARTIQRIEEARDDANPTLRVLEVLGKALGVPATELTNPVLTVMGQRFV
jgi:ribosome-binding protein aMBF1 (putative translation factor)